MLDKLAFIVLDKLAFIWYSYLEKEVGILFPTLSTAQGLTGCISMQFGSCLFVWLCFLWAAVKPFIFLLEVFWHQ